MLHSTDIDDISNSLSNLSLPTSNIKDKWKLIGKYVQTQGLVKQHINSFNYFIDYGLSKILKANEHVVFTENNQLYLKYKNIRIKKPSVIEFKGGRPKERLLKPQECRTRGITYAGDILVDIYYTPTPTSNNNRSINTVCQKGVCIGKIPIMLRSNKCCLINQTNDELYESKECLYDPGGYFIVKGRERVILIQEQLAKNKIIIAKDDKLGLCAHITSSTVDIKSRTSLFFRNEAIFVQHNSFTQPIPLVIIFLAMGVESSQEIAQLVGLDVLNELVPSLEMIHRNVVEYPGLPDKLPVTTTKLARIFISNRLMSGKINTNTGSLVDQKIRNGKHCVERMLFAHVKSLSNENEDFLSTKVIYLAQCTRKLLLSLNNENCIDDKDYYGNKRLELSGHLMSLLFEDKFKAMNEILKHHVNKRLRQKVSTSILNIPNILASINILETGIEIALKTGNFTLQRFKMNRQGITQVVTRLSYVSCIGHMTRISSSVEKSRKVSGPRSLHGSQWGMICPSDTPEGEGCGLIKNLSLTIHVSLEEDWTQIGVICFCFGVEDLRLKPRMLLNDINNDNRYIVWINGNCIGVHNNGHKLVHDLRQLRRKGKGINKFTSIYIDINNNCVKIQTDAGRSCRPLIIVDNNGNTLLNSDHLNDLNKNILTFDDLIDYGILEYIDVDEENNCYIALTENDIINGKTTHLEIDPMSILGCVSGLIPYPHHNQSPRNTYQCAMGKQAMGIIGTNESFRNDSLRYTLVYTQQPMVQTKTIKNCNFNNMPAGCNSIIAVMSFSGYDIEDAIILNKASLDRGFMRCIVNRSQEISFDKYVNETRDMLSNNPKRFENDPKLCALDLDGIALPGQKVFKKKGKLAKKHVPKNTENIIQSVNTENIEYYEEELTWRHMNDARIEKVTCTSNNRYDMLFRINTSEHRRPEIGDKFSSRHGQKGVTGLIVPQRDMPFNDDGICPDLIMNPHGFPSRMTVGKMLELVSGKSGILNGYIGDGTAFSGDKYNDIKELLVKCGYHYSGKDYLTSGITGEGMLSYIFMGPIFYQKLKHMVCDKMHARGQGPVTKICKQPTEGRSKEGGLRVGEMERDCLIGHGTSMLLYERLCISSDIYNIIVCNQCGLIQYNKYKCYYCNNNNTLCNVKLPYACKLLFQELTSMNIKPKINVSDFFS